MQNRNRLREIANKLEVTKEEKEWGEVHVRSMGLKVQSTMHKTDEQVYTVYHRES